MADDKVSDMDMIRKHPEANEGDLVRSMVQMLSERLMGAQADALCGTNLGQRTSDRLKQRNGYRLRPWDTKSGRIELKVPKLRSGSYFPTG